MSPTRVSAPWTAVAVGSGARGFENGSYQQDEEQSHHHQHHQQEEEEEEEEEVSCPPSTSGNSKVSLVPFYRR